MAHEKRPHDLHDDFLATLTRENYLKFRLLYTQSLPTLPPSHHEPDRIPSTTPGAEPPRDAKDSGSARSHSMHLETSSSYRP